MSETGVVCANQPQPIPQETVVRFDPDSGCCMETGSEPRDWPGGGSTRWWRQRCFRLGWYGSVLELFGHG